MLGAAASRRGDTVELPCVAMVPPSLIDYVISRDLAHGVVIAGCAESSCYNRSGVAWTEQRIAGQRDPYLRTRVDRARLTTIWASPTQRPHFAEALSTFTAAVAALPPKPAKPAYFPSAAPRVEESVP
jgi:coenzyme F420-reducing hydrogenase delta subunit